MVGSTEKPYAPMTVVGDVNQDGLGLVSWWTEEDEEEQQGGNNGAAG